MLFKNISQLYIDSVFLDIDVGHSEQRLVVSYATVPFLVFCKDSHAYQG